MAFYELTLFFAYGRLTSLYYVLTDLQVYSINNQVIRTAFLPKHQIRI